MSAEQWVKWGGKYVQNGFREVSQPDPSPFVAIENAWIGAEDSLKGVLVKDSINWDNRRAHDLQYLIGLIDSNGLATGSQISQLQAGAITIMTSGSYTSYKYPETDPTFYESLTVDEVTKRINCSRDINTICFTLVSSAVSYS